MLGAITPPRSGGTVREWRPLVPGGIRAKRARPDRHRLASAGYTSSMKTAISIPDDVFAGVESLAQRLNVTRSGVFTEAAREYLARHDAEEVTAALNGVCTEFSPALDPAVSAAARQLLERTEW